jgi:hypothetical protein
MGRGGAGGDRCLIATWQRITPRSVAAAIRGS